MNIRFEMYPGQAFPWHLVVKKNGSLLLARPCDTLSQVRCKIQRYVNDLGYDEKAVEFILYLDHAGNTSIPIITEEDWVMALLTYS